tara:strand:- start:334 stop:477 length:144 start_codon:yes stop_codon:yes gene_type:complete
LDHLWELREKVLDLLQEPMQGLLQELELEDQELLREKVQLEWEQELV